MTDVTRRTGGTRGAGTRNTYANRSGGRTCDRCLDGRHARCGDKLRCACACNNRKAAGRAAVPSVSRAATPSKPRPSRVGRGLGGRPQVYAGDVRQRRAAAMRAARAAHVDRAAAEAEMADDPSGLTWSIGTRRLFAADLDRLAAAAAGL